MSSGKCQTNSRFHLIAIHKVQLALARCNVHHRETGSIQRAPSRSPYPNRACSPQAHQLGDRLNQLRRIETHAILEDQLNLLHVFNLLRRVAAQHH
jgi:hypothetical protein